MTMPAIIRRISRGEADQRDAEYIANLFAPWLAERVPGAYDVLMADPTETRKRLTVEQRETLIHVLRQEES